MKNQSIQKIRLRIMIRGAVQGVGFRPTVFRLANERNLCGWVRNTAQGVIIEAEGREHDCREFLTSVQTDKPVHAVLQSIEISEMDPKGYKDFQILESESGEPTALILPDLCMCPECRADISDPKNRRYRYPFTNCTQCGPRYSIIERLPYDRANTTMKKFEMCPECSREYHDPADRRFHAQPNACPVCGPHLELWDRDGKILETRDAALMKAEQFLLDGKIVALKGLGGFQLAVDARNAQAIQRLRERKHRSAKPFAVMFPDLKGIQHECRVCEEEKNLLKSSASPIVLLEKRATLVSSEVAVGNPYLGAMLPYTPLHQILLGDLQIPLVMTSGNISEDPMCIDEQEAVKALKNIADVFLVHDRPIARAVDDSVARIVLNREFILRRARGYAPLPVLAQPEASAGDALAVGAHLKNTIAVKKGSNIFLSQHIGDLETENSYQAFVRTVDDLKAMYDIQPPLVFCDRHPDYLSTQYARKGNAAPQEIQHHVAHVFSCMAENDLNGSVLGVSWDGTGHGLDGTVWGGEFFAVKNTSIERMASIRPFPLPGGEKAIVEPRRCALGLLYESSRGHVEYYQDMEFLKSFSEVELKALIQILDHQKNSPLTSSVGRLFDAVASFVGFRQILEFEGQAAMEVEFAAQRAGSENYYQYELMENDEKAGPYSAGWHMDIALIDGVASDLKNGVAADEICGRFHNTLVEALVSTAKRVKIPKVVLTGGCFQNRYLLERAVRRLKEDGFKPYWHQRVPPNDGGIALGQIVAGLRTLQWV